jgi:dUTP pyrophosphatase
MIENEDFNLLNDKFKKIDELINQNRDNDDDEDEDDYDIYNKVLDELGVDMNDFDKAFDEYEPTLELGYVKLNDDAVTPFYNYPSDSGFDLYSTTDLEIPPFGRVLVPTGLSLDIKDGFEIQVRSKSGLALKQGLMVLNSPGTVDNGYTGEVQVIVFNTNSYKVFISKGMKIAQAVLCPVVNGKWVNLIEKTKINEKERGENGFGSTGI